MCVTTFVTAASRTYASSHNLHCPISGYGQQTVGGELYIRRDFSHRAAVLPRAAYRTELLRIGGGESMSGLREPTARVEKVTTATLLYLPFGVIMLFRSIRQSGQGSGARQAPVPVNVSSW